MRPNDSGGRIIFYSKLCSTHQNEKSTCVQSPVTVGCLLTASQQGKDVKNSLSSVFSAPSASPIAASAGSTHTVSCDDQLNDILGVLVQDFH